MMGGMKKGWSSGNGEAVMDLGSWQHLVAGPAGLAKPLLHRHHRLAHRHRHSNYLHHHPNHKVHLKKILILPPYGDFDKKTILDGVTRDNIRRPRNVTAMLP